MSFKPILPTFTYSGKVKSKALALLLLLFRLA